VEKEKDRSEGLLRNILPATIAEELKTSGTASPRFFDHVTVLFTDFKGFTQIAEKTTPEALIETLNECFLAFDEICDRHNLEKIKTIGDAYMAAGGIPEPNGTHALDAVRVALEMQAFMAQWKEERLSKGLLAWDCRIGINTGPVVAGVIGKRKFAYDIWGDAVNIAARMESSGEIGKVNISGATYEQVADYFRCTHRGKIEAKNKGEVDMYFVEGWK
jgi:class 3 adenylate cyclase